MRCHCCSNALEKPTRPTKAPTAIPIPPSVSRVLSRLRQRFLNANPENDNDVAAISRKASFCLRIERNRAASVPRRYLDALVQDNSGSKVYEGFSSFPAGLQDVPLNYGERIVVPKTSYFVRMALSYGATRKLKRWIRSDLVAVEGVNSWMTRKPELIRSACNVWRAQLVDATLACSLLAGVSKPKVFRGR